MRIPIPKVVDPRPSDTKLDEIDELRKLLKRLAVDYRISKWGQRCLLCEDTCDGGRTLYHTDTCLLNKARQRELQKIWDAEEQNARRPE